MAVFAALALGFFSAAVTVAVILRTKQKARGVAAVRLNPFESALLFFLITATMLVSISVSKAFSSFQSDVLKIYVPTLLVQFLTIAVVVFFTRHIGANLNFRPTLRSVKSGVAYFFATLSVLACGGCVAIIYKCVFGEDIERQSAVTLFMNIDGFWAKAMAAFSVVVLAPVAEELFFRGMLYPCVKGWILSAVSGNCGDCGVSREISGRDKILSAVFAAVIVSALFSMIHVSVYAALPIFLMGIILVCAYERTNSIVSPIITHSLFNMANVFMITVL